MNHITEDPASAAVLNVTFTESTGVNSEHAESVSLIYPNPTNGKLHIENPSAESFSYEIYTINGTLVVGRHHVTGSTIEVDMSDLASGMYFVQVHTADRSETHKIVLK